MIVNRDLAGSEIIEVAIIGGVLLCLAIGTVVILGGNLQNVFENEKSPIIVSAYKMQDGTSGTDIDARTNIDKSLITTIGGQRASGLITSDRSDYNIKTSVGTETTGGIGTGNIVGATWKDDKGNVVNWEGQEDTGNTMLNNAILAKDAAALEINEAKSAIGMAEQLQARADYLKDLASMETTYLGELKDNLDCLETQINELEVHKDLLIDLQILAGNISADLRDTLDYVDGVNDDIMQRTNTNLSFGQDLLSWNQSMLTAYSDYVALSNDIFASPSDVSDAENLFNSYASMVSSGTAAAQNTINDMQAEVQDKTKQADECFIKAEDLRNKAKDTLKSGFFDPSIFDGCNSVTDMIKKAEWALGKGGQKVVDKDAVREAMKLLRESDKAYRTAEHNKALATQYQNNMNQQQQILGLLSSQAATVSALAENVNNTAPITAKEQAAMAAYAAADPNILVAQKEIEKMGSTVTNAKVLLASQVATVKSIEDNSKQVSQEASTAFASATQLETQAQTAYTNAISVIDKLITY